MLAGLVLASGVTLVLTDLTGRTEVGRATHALGSAEGRLAEERSALVAGSRQMQSGYDQIRQVESATAGSQVDLTNTNASIGATDVGIFYDGIDVATLNGCLTGVIQALDQVAVGQVGSAVSSLEAVATPCQSVAP